PIRSNWLRSGKPRGGARRRAVLSAYILALEDVTDRRREAVWSRVRRGLGGILNKTCQSSDIITKALDSLGAWAQPPRERRPASISSRQDFVAEVCGSADARRG